VDALHIMTGSGSEELARRRRRSRGLPREARYWPPRVVARAATGRANATLLLRYYVRDPRPTCGKAFMRLVVLSSEGRVLARANALHTRVNRWHVVQVSTQALAPGKYLVVLRAMDLAGNYQRGVTHTTITVRS
jgi:hypothetical protein